MTDTTERVFIAKESGRKQVVYQGPSLKLAAEAARKRAAEGRDVRIRGPEGFRERLYKTEFSHRQRWHYVESCVKCRRPMYPDARSETCRKCWDPRNSDAHMAAIRRLNERRRQARLEHS